MNWIRKACSVLMFLEMIVPPSVSVVTKDDEDDAVDKSCEHEHTHIHSVHWFASDLPPVVPSGWENAADVAVRARYDRLNRGFQLAAASFSN